MLPQSAVARQESLKRIDSIAAATEPCGSLMPFNTQAAAIAAAAKVAISITFNIWLLTVAFFIWVTRFKSSIKPVAAIKPVATNIGGSQLVFHKGRALTMATSAPV